jgi:hypothetical protein
MNEYSNLSRDEQLEYHRKYNKKYYEVNKEKLKTNQRKKTECEFCKRQCNSHYLKHHLKSDICLNTQKMMSERLAKLNNL